jgi:hypothetical protein
MAAFEPEDIFDLSSAAVLFRIGIREHMPVLMPSATFKRLITVPEVGWYALGGLH